MTMNTLHPGDRLPRVAPLPGVDGRLHELGASTAEILVVVFSCNHCPYVQAYEERMIALQRDYAHALALVAINANDETNYPDDGFDRMVERHREIRMNYAYLRDASQEAAAAFGATHTPQFFVFDRERILRYAGKLDDNWKEPSKVTARYVRDAVDALLAGREVPLAETFSIGCTIKWRAS
jgi:thiol-disulfide isomerase/thioredoxin